MPEEKEGIIYPEAGVRYSPSLKMLSIHLNQVDWDAMKAKRCRDTERMFIQATVEACKTLYGKDAVKDLVVRGRTRNTPQPAMVTAVYSAEPDGTAVVDLQATIALMQKNGLPVELPMLLTGLYRILGSMPETKRVAFTVEGRNGDAVAAHNAA